MSIVYVLFLFTYSRHLFLYISFVHYSFKQTVLKKFRIRVFFKDFLIRDAFKGHGQLYTKTIFEFIDSAFFFLLVSNVVLPKALYYIVWRK